MDIRRPITDHLILLASLLVIGFLAYNIQNIMADNQPAAVVESMEEPVVAPKSLQPVPVRDESLADPQLTALSVVSLESNLLGKETVLLQKNDSIRLPIASLTKLMTAMVVMDSYGLDESIVISPAAVAQDSAEKGPDAGNVFSVEWGMRIMLVESNNRVAYAFAEKMGEDAFISRMNAKAAAIGLHNTRFYEPTGLADRNYSTASDLATLAVYLLKHYPFIVETSQVQQMDVPGFRQVTNTNQLLGQVPEIIVGKTGFTTDAKECLLLVLYNPNADDYFINVLLGSSDRFAEMRQVINWVPEAYQWQ